MVYTSFLASPGGRITVVYTSSLASLGGNNRVNLSSLASLGGNNRGLNPGMREVNPRYNLGCERLTLGITRDVRGIP